MNHFPCLVSCLWRLWPCVLLSACSHELARRPELPSDQQSHARVDADPLQPLIVEWPASERVALEAKLRQGPVAVRYDGRTLRVLARCQAPGVYAFQGTQIHRDSLTIEDQDALNAQLPLGAASLSSSLSRLGKLQLDLTLIGTYLSSESDVERGLLRGDCEGATHLVASVTVGAFELHNASSTALGGGVGVSGIGAGLDSSSRRDVVARAGEMSTCSSASPDAKAPPSNCGALVRLGLRPLVEPPPRLSSPLPSDSVAPPPPVPPRTVTAVRPRPVAPPSPPPAEPTRTSAFWPTALGIGVVTVVVGLVVAGVIVGKNKDETSREPVPTGNLGNVSLPAGIRW